jgi:hypothetical protein
MFRCAAAGYVSTLYEAAGLRDVVAALRQIGEPARERIAKAVIAKVSTYEEDGKVRIPGVARCIVGTK